MNGVEFFRNTVLETCKPDLLEKYRYTQRTIQEAIFAVLEPSPFAQADATSGLGLALIRLQKLPSSAQDKLNPQDPLTKAAMLIGAVSLRAWVYKSEINGYEHQNFESIWEKTKLQKLAAKCDEVVSEIVPETNGKYVSIDMPKMHSTFSENLHLGVPEHIVLTGLNAVGKSFIIKLFTEYLGDCEISSKVVKLPRPDGPISQVINAALNGELKINKEALQLAFLSDALDIEPEPDTLMVFDRHPRIESYVYGPSTLARTVLSTHEVFDDIYHTYIIDQHPMACALKVAKRDRSPRIFEKDTEAMTEQVIRFSRLTVLPGIHWINNDIPIYKGGPQNWNLQISMSRFMGSVFYTGVLQRLLLKQGRFNSYHEASGFLYNKFIKYENKWENLPASS